MSVDLERIFDITTQVVGTAAIIAAVTPNKTDNKIIDMIAGIIHLLAFNFGYAKNYNGDRY